MEIILLAILLWIISRMCTNVNVSNFIHWLEKRDIPFVCFGSDKKQFVSYLIQSPADSFTYQSFSYRELKEISCSYCPTALIHIIAPRSAITLPPHSAGFDIFFTITSHIPSDKKAISPNMDCTNMKSNAWVF